MKPTTPIRRILDYEVRASWWASYIHIGWMQNLASRYFAWKVKRKYAQWTRSLNNLHNLNKLKGQ